MCDTNKKSGRNVSYMYVLSLTQLFQPEVTCSKLMMETLEICLKLTIRTPAGLLLFNEKILI